MTGPAGSFTLLQRIRQAGIPVPCSFSSIHLSAIMPGSRLSLISKVPMMKMLPAFTKVSVPGKCLTTWLMLINYHGPSGQGFGSSKDFNLQFTIDYLQMDLQFSIDNI